jgi:sugar transferase (PEP-CTERM/EpsH1 system associated)
MRVLQFAPRICWPLDTGAKLRNYHLARVLSERSEVSLLTFAESEQVPPELENLYHEIVSVQRDGSYSVGKLLRGALGKTPLPLLNYTTEEMRQALARLLVDNRFDIVQVESIHLMKYVPTIRTSEISPVVVCDWHNIESELMKQYSDHERNLGRKAYARRTARLISYAEHRALSEFDAHVVVSEQDADYLRRMKSDATVTVIENGVDTAHFATEKTKGNRIVFVASMDYHANIEGAIDFSRHAWPSVRRQKSDLVFTIVGRDPAPSVRELNSIAGVEVTGSVADVRPYYREAIVAVVPLNVGGGSRLKILEAMAAGVPVVSTVRGADGLKVRDRKNILLANTIEEMAGLINIVVDDSDLRNQLIAGGRSLVAERYDWSTVGGTLFDHYQRLLSGRRL